MKYDPSLIEETVEVIGGREVKVQKIPAGMPGPNGAFASSYFEEDEDDSYDALESKEAFKEYEDYVNEGTEPDDDEVRGIKEEIEKEMSLDLLDPLEEEDDEDKSDD